MLWMDETYVVTYNILLRSLCYAGRWEDAEALLAEMSSDLCTALDSYEHAGYFLFPFFFVALSAFCLM